LGNIKKGDSVRSVLGFFLFATFILFNAQSALADTPLEKATVIAERSPWDINEYWFGWCRSDDDCVDVNFEVIYPNTGDLTNVVATLKDKNGAGDYSGQILCLDSACKNLNVKISKLKNPLKGMALIQHRRYENAKLEFQWNGIREITIDQWDGYDTTEMERVNFLDRIFPKINGVIEINKIASRYSVQAMSDLDMDHPTTPVDIGQVKKGVIWINNFGAYETLKNMNVVMSGHGFSTDNGSQAVSENTHVQSVKISKDSIIFNTMMNSFDDGPEKGSVTLTASWGSGNPFILP
jgi:hypothetical protein